MQPNSFLHSPTELHHDRYNPEDVLEALDRTEELAWERINTVLANASKDRTFENTVLAISRATDEFDFLETVVGHLRGVLGEPWRVADELVTDRSSALNNKISLHKGIYDALIDYRDRSNHSDILDASRRKLLNEMIIEFERSGIALPRADQEELKSIRAELNVLRDEFDKNVVDASDNTGFEVTNRRELEGLNDEFIQRCLDDARGMEKNGYWIAYSQPSYAYVMSSCRVGATREGYYSTCIRRAAETNEPVAHKILALRRRLAIILGYKNFADYILERRMAKSGDVAMSFISELTEKYHPKMIREYEELLSFARKYENNPSLELAATDVDSGLDLYYSAQLSASVVGIDENELRAYFELNNVLEVMFSTLKVLYGVDIRQVELPSWHRDVRVFEIHDGDKHLSTVWCDLYARKGKRPGAWANISHVAERAKNNFNEPQLGYVTANLESPGSTGRCRMTLRDVETIWHEFGHYMHITLGTTELREQSAFSTRWDFIEAPSQIMENWVWQPEIMRQLARHEATGETLGDDILERLLAGRVFHVGIKAMRQLCFAAVDLKLHLEFESSDSEGVIAFARRVKEQYLPVPVFESDANIASFSHIFAGGYAAAYYSYKWAEVIEADFFSRFKREGCLNPETGRAYRNDVLARGSEVEPSELIQAFLGRQANTDAMLKRDGVSG